MSLDEDELDDDEEEEEESLADRELPAEPISVDVVEQE